MEVILTKLSGKGHGIHLHGEGIVLRCDCEGSQKRGFAASAQFHPETAGMVLSRINVSWQVT